MASNNRTYPGRGLHAEIVETIATRITTGQYLPGELIFSEALEADLEVSKTVVREALKVLAAKGMVESRPKRGTTVRPREAWNLLDPDLLYWRGGQPDVEFLQDLSEVRFIVEPEAARLAASRREEGDLSAMGVALEAMTKAHDAVDAPNFIEADLAFHRALLVAAHNELLTRMEVVIEAGLRVRDQLVHGKPDWSNSLIEHGAISDAVRNGNPNGAADATRVLLTRGVADAEASLGAVLPSSTREPGAEAASTERSG